MLQVPPERTRFMHRNRFELACDAFWPSRNSLDITHTATTSLISAQVEAGVRFVVLWETSFHDDEQG